MRVAGVIVFLLVFSLAVTSITITHAETTQPSNCKYYFIIYGQDWCPHCQNMENFVIKNYGARCLEFRDLDVPRWNQNYTQIIDELNNKYKVPAQAAFPLTGILVNGKLRAILQGEITSTQIMDYLVKRADKEGAQWITVYTNGLYVIQPDQAIIHAYLPEHPSNSIGVKIPGETTNNTGGGIKHAYIIAGIIVILLGAITAYYIWRG